MLEISMFGKKIILDEENKGIDFMIHELCEYPLENWAICEHDLIFHKKSEESEMILKNMSQNELMTFVVNAIIHTIDVSSMLDEDICRRYSDAIRTDYKSYVWDNYK